MQVSPREKRQRRLQKEQKLLLRKPHQIPNPPNHKPTQPLQNPSQAQARLPPKTLPRTPSNKTAQPAARNPDEDEPPAPTKYVRAYQAAGKKWLYIVVKDRVAAYNRLFDELLKLGDPYIDNFDQAGREQVLKCIRDKTGRFLDDDDFVTSVETEEEKEKPRYMFTGEAKAALTDYYDAVTTLCEAQQNFAKSTQVLEKKITDKSVFLDIIKQVQLPSVKVEIRTVEELERMEGKTYRELTLMCHLPNFKRINPNAKKQTRMVAAYIYCVLYEQITGVRASQTGCAMDFKCPKTSFKRLITGKRQPGGPGRLSEGRGRSGRSLEDVAEMEGMEGPTLAKRTRKATKSATAAKPKPKPKSGGKKGK